MLWVFVDYASEKKMVQQMQPAIVHFTMSLPEAHQHIRNLELAAESAEPAGREALKSWCCEGKPKASLKVAIMAERQLRT
jgi:hypothetical protein